MNDNERAIVLFFCVIGAAGFLAAGIVAAAIVVLVHLI